jgi:hypothetical protein
MIPPKDFLAEDPSEWKDIAASGFPRLPSDSHRRETYFWLRESQVMEVDETRQRIVARHAP